MSTPIVTDEQIAAAQLRLVLDRKLGRDTPEVIRQIAASPSTRRAEKQIEQPTPDPREEHANSGSVSGPGVQENPVTGSADPQSVPEQALADQLTRLEHRIEELGADTRHTHELVSRVADISQLLAERLGSEYR